MDAMQVNPQPVTTEDTNKNIVKQGRKVFNRIGLIFFVASLVILAVQKLTNYLLTEYVSRAVRQDMNLLMTLNVIVVYAIGLPIIMLLLKTVPDRKPEKHKMSVGSFLIAILMCYSLVYITNWIGIGITYVIGLLKGSPVQDNVQMVTTALHPALSILYTVICAPIMEELVFRKCLINRTLKYGEGVSILLSGLMFGLFHANLNQFVYTFIMGVFWGFIYIKTGRIIYSMIMHAVMNFFGGVVAPLLLQMLADAATGVMKNTDGEAQFSAILDMVSAYGILLCYALLILGAVIAGIVLLIVFRKRFKLASGEIKIPKGKGFVVVFVNVGMIAFVAFYVYQIVQQLLA